MDTLTLLGQILGKSNLSRARLAELLGTSLVSVTRWQRGIGAPNPSQAQRLAEIYHSLIEGRVPVAYASNPFSSRGARNRVGGQGILGETLSVIKPSATRQASILTRLMNNAVFSDDDHFTIDRLLQAHSVPACTMQTPFAGGISAGKNTYTYDAHTYHTKVPPQGISELLSYLCRKAAWCSIRSPGVE